MHQDDSRGPVVITSPIQRCSDSSEWLASCVSDPMERKGIAVWFTIFLSTLISAACPNLAAIIKKQVSIPALGKGKEEEKVKGKT